MSVLKVSPNGNSFDLLPMIQMLCAFAVVMVEEPGNGKEKKRKAIEIVKGFLKNFNIPVPMTLVNLILPLIVDKVVDMLNKLIWKS